MAEQLWDHGHPGIYIESSDPMFFQKAIDALNKIYSKPVGKALLKTITGKIQFDGSSKKIVIDASTASSKSTPHGEKDADVATPTAVGKLKFVAGDGCGSTINWNPDRHQTNGRAIPSFVVLAHELIHGMHSLHGDLQASYDEHDGWEHEETRTVGVGIYADEPICENAIRKEHSRERRDDYSGHDGCGLAREGAFYVPPAKSIKQLFHEGLRKQRVLAGYGRGGDKRGHSTNGTGTFLSRFVSY